MEKTSPKAHSGNSNCRGVEVDAKGGLGRCKGGGGEDCIKGRIIQNLKKAGRSAKEGRELKRGRSKKAMQSQAALSKVSS
jgi:hypothetical protein